MNKDVCECCGHTEIHYSSCKNVNYPSCQVYDREVRTHKQSRFTLNANYFLYNFIRLEYSGVNQS